MTRLKNSACLFPTSNVWVEGKSFQARLTLWLSSHIWKEGTPTPIFHMVWTAAIWLVSHLHGSGNIISTVIRLVFPLFACQDFFITLSRHTLITPISDPSTIVPSMCSISWDCFNVTKYYSKLAPKTNSSLTAQIQFSPFKPQKSCPKEVVVRKLR